MKTSKTETISGVMMVESAGHSCIGVMSWESPYVVFKHGDDTIVWHSDNVETESARFGFPRMGDMVGRWVSVECRVRLAKRQPLFGRNLRVQRMLKLDDQ